MTGQANSLIVQMGRRETQQKILAWVIGESS